VVAHLGRGLVDEEELRVHPLLGDPQVGEDRAGVDDHAERAAQPDVVHGGQGH
jgi:hypothetical protein